MPVTVFLADHLGRQALLLVALHVFHVAARTEHGATTRMLRSRVMSAQACAISRGRALGGAALREQPAA